MTYSHQDLTRLLLAEFRDLEDDLRSCDGLLHLEMGVLAHIMQRAKKREDWSTYERAVRLADTLWSRSEDAVQNALSVSLLEHLDFEGPRGPKAWSLPTPALRKGWKDIMAHLASLKIRSQKRRDSQRWVEGTLIVEPQALMEFSVSLRSAIRAQELK